MTPNCLAAMKTEKKAVLSFFELVSARYPKMEAPAPAPIPTAQDIC